MARTRQCPECDAPVRLNKRYCPECHAMVNPRHPRTQLIKVREETSFKTMLLLGLAGMAFFFSFGFFLPAVLAEPGSSGYRQRCSLSALRCLSPRGP
jgi:uncharacterized paraquat-inducible protein A